jgi:uncharacterized UBP type Zn finger protein
VERLLQEQKPESSAEAIPYHLVGYLALMERLIEYCTVKEELTAFLLNKCLIPCSANAEVLCRCSESKTSALKLLGVLVREEQHHSTLSKLSSLHKEGAWRSRRIDDWFLNTSEKIKSGCGYVGLKNLGCICYINSFLQQIFMIPDFRNAILQCEDPLETKEPDSENLLHQLKKLFLNLLFSEKKYYTPL